jgi:hypothetical protein
LAVALGQRLVLACGLRDPGGASLHFVTATDGPEAVTALAWLASASASAGEGCLLVGTSLGFLQLHAEGGPKPGCMLHRQELHHRPVNSIHIRRAPARADPVSFRALQLHPQCAVVCAQSPSTRPLVPCASRAAAACRGAAPTRRWSGSGIDPHDAGEDVTVGFADAVARLPSFDVWAVVRWHLRSSQAAGWWGAGAAHQLSPAKYEYRGAGPRGAAACCGAAPPALYELLAGRQQPPRLLLFTAGSKPPLAMFHVEEGAAPGLLSLVSGLARSYLPGRGAPRGEAAAGVAGGKGPKRERIAGARASPAAAVWDDKRSVTSAALSPW